MSNYKYSFPFDEIMAESLVDLQQQAFPSIMPVQTPWKLLEKAIVASNQENLLSESEFPFLDAKPEVDEYKKEVKKGRFNANEQLMKKKLAGQAYILKQVVGEGKCGKAIGKKRRARLLSNEETEMKLNVPYSMNRKNRWEMESAVELLQNRESSKDVQLSAMDQHLTVKGLSPNKEVLAFHQIGEDGVLNTRNSHSQRGSALSELNSTSCEEKPLSIRYVMAKAHSNGKGLTSSIDKAKPLSRSTRRAALDLSVYSTDNETETEANDELLSPTQKMYTTPQRRSYSLADFVTDRQQAVLVKAPRTRRLALDSFVEVEMPELQEDVDHRTMSSPMSKIGQTSSLFKTFYVQCERIGIVSQADWIAHCAKLSERPELHFQWLNKALCSFQVDLTSLLMTSKSPHLVMTAAYESQESRVRILLNGSTECQANLALLNTMFSTDQFNGLEGLIQSLVKNVTIKNVEKTNTELLGAYSAELSIAITPIDDYSLLYGPKSGCSPNTQTVPTIEEDEEEGDDGFEQIDMAEVIGSDQMLETKWSDPAIENEFNQMKTLCDECGENTATKIVHLTTCGHSFCSRCLKASLYQQICENTPSLCCSFKNCLASISMPILQSIFELPIVIMALHSCAEENAKQLGNKVFACPSGCGLTFLKASENKLNQVQCNSCKHHFCSECQNSPHFPLTCEQNSVWASKCMLQSQKPTIDQQYWTMCSEARKRRDIPKAAKDVLKRAGHKLERQFLEVRKACLQLVEFGFAWLYLTRNDRPQNWQQIKSILNGLYKELNSIENSLLNNTLNVEDKMEDKIKKVRVTLKKCTSELQSINNNH